jgi:hypothetical protein
MNRPQLISALVDQIEGHRFSFLYRNRRIAGHTGVGWAGALSLYSANTNRPDPAAHFAWLNTITARVGAATTAPDKISIANDVLKWGGMGTRISNDRGGQALLTSVIASATEGYCVDNAPMNSSYTKIAAVFCYGVNNYNSIWDSRVSTALCFRLGCILEKAGMSREEATEYFPELGYVPGKSLRVGARLGAITPFWPNVYSTWSGHFAGAKVALEVSDELNRRAIPHPNIQQDAMPGTWTPWKVNMVLFVDDIIQCPNSTSQRKKPGDQQTVGGGRRGGPPAGVRTAREISDGDGLCEHQIVPRNHGICFEPNVIAGALNNAPRSNLPLGDYGLQDRRLLLEFFRLKKTGDCKISCRVRVADPRFDQLLRIALAANCPQRRGGVSMAGSTESIFVYELGKIQPGHDLAAIKKFTCNPEASYQKFLRHLPEALRLP